MYCVLLHCWIAVDRSAVLLIWCVSNQASILLLAVVFIFVGPMHTVFGPTCSEEDTEKNQVAPSSRKVPKQLNCKQVW